MELQEGISQQICAQQLGKTLRVMIDGSDETTGIYIGRTMGQAPQVDGVTYVTSEKALTPGALCDVRIREAYEYDLLGEIE